MQHAFAVQVRQATSDAQQQLEQLFEAVLLLQVEQALLLVQRIEQRAATHELCKIRVSEQRENARFTSDKNELFVGADR